MEHESDGDIKRFIKGLDNLEIRGKVETRLTELLKLTVLLRSTRILKRVQETWGDLLSFKLLWETIS